MTRILIAGCGDVGSLAGVKLAGDGHDVWGLRRRVDALPPEIQTLAADLTSPDDLRDLPCDLGLVLYTAAAGGHDEASYRRAYVDGLQNLLAALVEQGQAPKRVIFTSSTAVYAQNDGAWLDEDSPTEPGRFTGQLVLEGERLLAGSPFASTVLRLGGIYGPGRDGMIERLRSGHAKRSPDWTTRFTNRIHRADAAGALAHLATMNAPESLYLGVDSEPTTEADLLKWFAERLGVPVPDQVSDPQRLAGSKRCRNARLLATGYRFRYPSFREGYSAQLERT